MTIEDVRSGVASLLDDGEDPDSDHSRAGILLLSSLIVGAGNRDLQRFTRLPPDFIRRAGYYGRQGGIWTRGPGNRWHTITSEWWDGDEASSVVGFTMDCMVLTGDLARIVKWAGDGTPEFQYGLKANRALAEADAYEKLEQMRWGGHPACPLCGVDRPYFLRPHNGVERATRTGAMSQRRVWKCRSCRKQFSVLHGTPFQGARVPARVILASCRGVSGVRETERRFDVTARTAARIIARCS